MLTQHIVRAQLDAIAAEVLHMPGMYYELYSRLFSQRVQMWMKNVSRAEAVMIERVAELDPDYCPHLDNTEIEFAESEMPTRHFGTSALFNPAWDVQY